MPTNSEVIFETLLHVVRYLAGSIPSGHDSSRPLSAVLPQLESIVKEIHAQAKSDIVELKAVVDELDSAPVSTPPITQPTPVVDKPVAAATEHPIVKAPAPAFTPATPGPTAPPIK